MGLSGAAFKLTMAPNLFVAEIHSEMGMEAYAADPMA